MFELSYAMATGKIVKEDISILSDNNSELLVVGLFLNYFNNAKNYKLHYSEVDDNIIGITFKNRIFPILLPYKKNKSRKRANIDTRSKCLLSFL